MYLTNLYPKPLGFEENECERFVFGAKLTAKVEGLSRAAAGRVKSLWQHFSCGVCKLELTEGADGYSFSVGEVECDLKKDDYYALCVASNGIKVKGRDERSLFDGITTLLQLICPDDLSVGNESLYISAAEIHDSPAIPFRAVHLCVFPDTKLYNIEKAIHLAGFLKLTHVILEFWGTFRYECLPELSWKDKSFSKKDLKYLIDLMRSYGMQPIPMSNQLGHATQSRARYGRHVVLNTNPRLSRFFEPDGWTWCLSNPDTVKLLREMRGEMIDFCGEGEFFHLGFDESYSFATCDRCRKKIPHEILSDFLNGVTEELLAAGRRPIIWHDQLIRHSDFSNFKEGSYVIASGDNKNTAEAIDHLSRDIIVADWQYGYTKGFNPTTKYFIDKGFDTLVCPWSNAENILSLANDAKKYNAFGILITTWDHLPAWLSDAAFAAGCIWEKSEERPAYAVTEEAAILRKLFDSAGDYFSSGWNMNEVIQ